MTPLFFPLIKSAWIRNLCIAMLVLLPMQAPSSGIESEDMKDVNLLVFGFDDPAEISKWRVVNDGVMGGLSQGKIVPTGDRTALFHGVLSLDNNGGFSSTRTTPTAYNLEGYDALEIRVRGDGRTYQFRIRTNDRFDGIAYRQTFSTSSGEWLTIQLPINDFVPVFRGRMLQDAAALSAAEIRQIGFLIADQQDGPFNLEIDWIKALKLP